MGCVPSQVSDFIKCWEITDNISETEQDRDMVTTEITCGLYQIAL